MKKPKGYPTRDGKIKIAVTLDRDVFDAVIRNGEKRDCSFSESINDIAKCGILCLRDAGDLPWAEAASISKENA